jgi:hypothetical protein
VTGTISITVDIPIKVSTISIQVAGSTTLTAVNDTVALTANVEPGNATNKSVGWSSNKESVATVAEDGVVTAVANGTATITATAKDGSGKFDIIQITVSIPATPEEKEEALEELFDDDSLDIVVDEDGSATITVPSGTDELDIDIPGDGTTVVITTPDGEELTLPLHLEDGETEIIIIITPPGGGTVIEIPVTIIKEPLSNDVSISAVSVNGTPATSVDGVNYTADIGTETEADVVVTAATGANVQYKLGSGTYQSSGNFTIAEATNTITITVTAEDGTTKDYTLTVTKTITGTPGGFELTWNNPVIRINDEESPDHTTITITVLGNYTTYLWTVDGQIIQSGTNTFTFNKGVGTFFTLIVNGGDADHLTSVDFSYKAKVGVEL